MAVEVRQPRSVDLSEIDLALDLGGYRVKSVEPHATSLSLPSHMGLTHDGRILVSEFSAGRVRDITEAGDYADTSKGAYATGLIRPGGIAPLADGRIMVADAALGSIFDISEPGPATSDDAVFTDVPHPYSLLEANGKIFVSYSNDEWAGVVEVVPGSGFSADEPTFVHSFPVVKTMEPFRSQTGCGGSWATTLKDGRFMFGHAALGAIYDVTDGGHFYELRDKRYAWGLQQPLGMIIDPLDGNLYVCERYSGVIKRIPHSGGYARFAEPLMAGFQEPSCIRFTADGKHAYVCDRALDTVYHLDLEHI
jgi:DNA-binding beta-propeller fold protein YncE